MITRRHLIRTASQVASLFALGQSQPVMAQKGGRPLRSAQRSTLNVSAGDYYFDHKFINCVKGGSRIIGAPGSNATWYLEINDDHYPTEEARGIGFSIPLNGPGTYVAKWRGRGALTSPSFGNKRNAPAGSWRGGGADGNPVENGRFTFSSEGYITVYLKGPSVSDLVVCRAEEEARHDAGEIFRADYLHLLREFNGILRFSVGPDFTNRNVLRNWGDRPRASLLTYNSGRYVAQGKIGLARGQNHYQTMQPGGRPAAYAHGEIVHFHPEQDSSADDCTLDVGGRGAKPLLNEYLQKSATSGSNAATRLIARSNYTAIFDATLDAWLFNPQFAVAGHPLEVMIAECNAAGLPGWFSIPFYASDDYVKNAAQLFCEHYKPDTIYFEYANEIWNYGFGFPMTARSARYGQKLFGRNGNGLADLSSWYAVRFTQIARLIRQVFAARGQSGKVRMVLAGQGALGDKPDVLAYAIEDRRFRNEAVAEMRGDSAAINQADVISYALYYGGATFSYGKGWDRAIAKADTVKALVADFESKAPDRIASTFAWMKNDFLEGARATLSETGRFANWNRLAAKYGKEVMLYEGNHEVEPPGKEWCARYLGDESLGGPGGRIDRLLLAFFGSADYETVVQTYLSAFYALSQSRAASLFFIPGASPWRVFPETGRMPGGDTLNAPLANWRAHVKWNNGKS